MILVDLSGVVYSTISIQIKKEKISEDLIRSMTLNCLRSYRSKWGAEYGELVLCSDAKHSWRKDVFPYYKARRKADRAASGIDWPTIFKAMDNIKAELRDTFPYKFIEVESAEADDVIAAIVNSMHGKDSAPIGEVEKILILSGDTDFVQLHGPMVKQYDPIRKKWIKSNLGERYLVEHIIEGDVSDGIPNVRSADNCLAIKTRQNVITKKFIETFDLQLVGSEVLRNYKRNEMLIDLTMTPEAIKLKIMEEFGKEPVGNRSKLFNYFFKKQLKNLMSSIGDF
jgi:5'-3' exonuclease, N-terminal resolvase-like domain/T4 RNase H, C terminal